jgi:hypothetical protein
MGVLKGYLSYLGHLGDTNRLYRVHKIFIWVV